MLNPDTDFLRPVQLLMGLPFDAVSLDEAVQRVEAAARERRGCFLSTPNLNWLVACQTDPAFRNSVLKSDLSLADGMPIIWLARLLGLPVTQRVSGSDVFQALRACAVSVYFFGGPPGFAGRACEKLNAAGAPMTCRGHHSPGFGSIEDMSGAEVLDDINASAADFVVVALGARKGQAWIEHNLDRLAPPLVSHLGAVVNFVAGSVARAPALVARLGLEWVWRIKEEPALWRRYFMDGLGFLGYLARHGLAARGLSRDAARRADPASGRVRVVADAQRCQIALAGDWTRANITRLGSALAQHCQQPRDLNLDLSGLGRADGAFLGLLAVLRGHQLKHGRVLEIQPPRGAARDLFRHFAADYLLDFLAGSGA